MNEDYVILVDEKDQQIGLMEKLEAHQKGVLHRAFSVFIFNSKKELLLQRRAIDKSLCGGLWTNTCCSHQKAKEIGEVLESVAYVTKVETIETNIIIFYVDEKIGADNFIQKMKTTINLSH
mgnify:CR=1 FL=1